MIIFIIILIIHIACFSTVLHKVPTVYVWYTVHIHDCHFSNWYSNRYSNDLWAFRLQIWHGSQTEFTQTQGGGVVLLFTLFYFFKFFFCATNVRDVRLIRKGTVFTWIPDDFLSGDPHFLFPEKRHSQNSDCQASFPYKGFPVTVFNSSYYHYHYYSSLRQGLLVQNDL